MKRACLVLALVLVCLLAFGALFYYGGELRAELRCISANAAKYPDAFDAVCKVLSDNTAHEVFSSETPQDASIYTLCDVDLSISNPGFFDAEWLNIQLEGIGGDVAVYSLTGECMDVPARSTAQLNLKLLTRAPSGSTRKLIIQYYTYGISRSIDLELTI